MITVQHVFQAGRDLIRSQTTLLNSLERGTAQRQLIEFRIMANNRLAIASAADVELKAIGAMFQSEIKSGERVFRRVTPRAAMAQKQEFA